MRVYRCSTQRESASEIRVETSASQQTRPPLEEQVASSAFDDATIGGVESIVALDDAENMSEYLEAFKCNTTRSYRLELGECYGTEDYEYDESEGTDQDEQPSVSDPVKAGRVASADERGRLAILEDETDEKPKVVTGEE